VKKNSKRYALLAQKVQKDKEYEIDEAITLLKELHSTKFDETVDLAVKLGIDTKKLQQPVRGSVALPHGTGKKVRILVITQGENVEKARQAGVELVGGEDIIAKIKEGWMAFDAVIATPDMMKAVAPLGKVLGPRGLMPSPKLGTVTFELEKIIDQLQKGRVDFKMEKDGNIHLPIGRVSFEGNRLKENAAAAIDAVVASKPPAAKGTFIRSLTLSLTMSPPVPLNVSRVTQTNVAGD